MGPGVQFLMEVQKQQLLPHRDILQEHVDSESLRFLDRYRRLLGGEIIEIAVKPTPLGVGHNGRLVIEFKARANVAQSAAIDEAIRTAQFARNKCLRLWMDEKGKGNMT